MNDAVLSFDTVFLDLPSEGQVLSGLSFSLAAGESLLLHGPAGSGKSAALALIVGLLAPTAGRVTVLGAEPATLAARTLDGLRAQVGYSPQYGALLSNLTLMDNVALPLRWHRGASPLVGATAVREAYALLGAEPPPPVQAAAAPEIHRQLARLAKAVILRPPLLVLDEPGGGLDADQREDLWRLIWRIQQDLGCAVLAATSDPGPARAFSERLVPLPPRRRNTLSILRPEPLL
jgi:ABC-type transporter Mla maintaining outer membrane lipid asymmetry ATPase subunit MlaF